MHVTRKLLALAATAAALAASPASAQFYFKAPALANGPVTGAEPGILGQAFPGATPEEVRAALVWNLRAGLNVAALQCDFEPTLLTVGNYNGMIKTHAAELKDSYDTLTRYFMRTAASPKAGQAALDQFGTRVYSGYSTTSAQYMFCQTASEIGRQVRFAAPGTLGEVARQRMRELRASLVIWGEQQFPSYYNVGIPNVPDYFAIEGCWKNDAYDAKLCEKTRKKMAKQKR